jgi:DNA modification methylase
LDTISADYSTGTIGVTVSQTKLTYLEKLAVLLRADLNFADKNRKPSPLHNFHSFPAKFPPELPRVFISKLTEPHDIILDPMSGSGTTILEASLLARKAIGFDIDPIALLISRVKTTYLDAIDVQTVASEVISAAETALKHDRETLEKEIGNAWDSKTSHFINYWFLKATQLELWALIREIKKIEDSGIRSFLELVFSGIIITKSGGVSRALDLGHTRPHRVETINEDTKGPVGPKMKRIRPAIKEFRKKLIANISALSQREIPDESIYTQVHYGFAQDIPLPDNSVDLVVTSPPYASNAIDYMRAHKFSLAWLGYPIDELGKRKSEYIGNERVDKGSNDNLPDFTQTILNEFEVIDSRKAGILRSYYKDMQAVLKEILRVLKPGKSAIVVVGNSTIRGKNSCTGECLADIGRDTGFIVPEPGIRIIDRDKRMMPAGSEIDLTSQVQQRMHKEFVIGLYKP